MPENNSLKQLLEKISTLEGKLGAQLGMGIWLYANVFEPTLKQDLIINTLDAQSIPIITEYIELANSILKLLKQPVIEINSQLTRTEKENLNIAFAEAMHFIYKFRFIAAQKSFAEYTLRRIHTPLEKKIIEIGHYDEDPESNLLYLLNLPDTIKINEIGKVDIEATTAFEATNHTLKIYFSVLPNVHSKTQIFFTLFFNKTTKGMVPRLYEKETKKLMEQLMIAMLVKPVKDIYKYLDRGYTVRQSTGNVLNYYKSIIESQKFSLLPDFAEVDKQLDSICRNNLDSIKALTEKTKNILTEELKEMTINFFLSSAMLPVNYYNLVFRKANKDENDERYYDYLLDSYLIEDSSTYSNHPIETYGIELSKQSKTVIFQAVTNGQINPQYTLQDYLAYQEVKSNVKS